MYTQPHPFSTHTRAGQPHPLPPTQGQESPPLTTHTEGACQPHLLLPTQGQESHTPYHPHRGGSANPLSPTQTRGGGGGEVSQPLTTHTEGVGQPLSTTQMGGGWEGVGAGHTCYQFEAVLPSINKLRAFLEVRLRMRAWLWGGEKEGKNVS